MSEDVNDDLLGMLACPRDHSEVRIVGRNLRCAFGHEYPIVNGIPVFLLAEMEQTMEIATASLNAAKSGIGGPLYLDTLGLSEHEKRGIEKGWISGGSKVDPAISYLVGATSGWGYVNLIGRLGSYPIPKIPIESGNNELLLDVGSGWGRWSVSAARKGWRVVGVDPSLGAILAAQRAFSSMGFKIFFVCGDARVLPFKADLFRCVFSYSVIQHFSEIDAELAIAEMGKVLRPGGTAKIQMAHKGGFRSRWVLSHPSYANAGKFKVRYWSLASMRGVFEKRIGPSKLVVEAFGGLGLLSEDRQYVSRKAKLLIAISVLLKKISVFVPGLIWIADSVYAVSVKRSAQEVGRK